MYSHLYIDWKNAIGAGVGVDGNVVGCDASGDVVKVGDAVKSIRVGDRVFGYTHGSSQPNNGAYSEYASFFLVYYLVEFFYFITNYIFCKFLNFVTHFNVGMCISERMLLWSSLQACHTLKQLLSPFPITQQCKSCTLAKISPSPLLPPQK